MESTEDFVIITKDLNFRPIRCGDERYIFPEVDEELTRYWIGWEPSHSIEEERQRVLDKVKLSEVSPNFEFLVFDKNNNFVGCCGISPSETAGEFEVNLWVVKREQGKGYGKKILQEAVEWAKKHSNLAYLVYSYTEGNEASAAIIHKIGAPLFREVVYPKRGIQKRVYDHKLVF